jgi:hypothetical protein
MALFRASFHWWGQTQYLRKLLNETIRKMERLEEESVEGTDLLDSPQRIKK